MKLLQNIALVLTFLCSTTTANKVEMKEAHTLTSRLSHPQNIKELVQLSTVSNALQAPDMFKDAIEALGKNVEFADKLLDLVQLDVLNKNFAGDAFDKFTGQVKESLPDQMANLGSLKSKLNGHYKGLRDAIKNANLLASGISKGLRSVVKMSALRENKAAGDNFTGKYDLKIWSKQAKYLSLGLKFSQEALFDITINLSNLMYESSQAEDDVRTVIRAADQWPELANGEEDLDATGPVLAKDHPVSLGLATRRQYFAGIVQMTLAKSSEASALSDASKKLQNALGKWSKQARKMDAGSFGKNANGSADQLAAGVKGLQEACNTVVEKVNTTRSKFV